MSVYRLIYVSDSLLEPDAIGWNVAQIRATSVVRNTSLAISGVLLLCRDRFVGVLEGELSAVRTMKAHIDRDPRHAHAVTLCERMHDGRIFSGWSLAYSGRSLFLSAMIDRALQGVDDGIQRLSRTVHEFSGDGSAPGGDLAGAV